MQRRQFNVAATLALGTTTGWARTPASASSENPLWRAIEAGVSGRLGVAVLDTADGAKPVHGWRLDERFAICSTFKWLLAAAVLRQVDAGLDRLDERVVYRREGLPAYAPVTLAHAGGRGMRVGELCDAAVTLSDNGAANLLLERLGGPASVTAVARALGDDVTRLDRNEPSLNEARPGDPRDTSTPRAMAASMRNALLGTVLSPAARRQLTDWLVASRTGALRLRAGLPASWRVGDKTGTGERGSTNDVAIGWPPSTSPIVVVAFLTECDAPLARREAALARVGREIARSASSGKPS